MNDTRGAEPKDAKSHILKCARRLLATEGEAGLQVRTLAIAAGRSASTIYHHFPSKEAIVDACIEDVYRDIRSLGPELLASLPETDNPAALIARATRIGFRLCRAETLTLRILLGNVVRNGGLDPSRRSAVQLPFIDAFESWLRAQHARPVPDVRLRIQSLIFLVARYACGADDDLEQVTGAASAEAAEVAIEEHLATHAVSWLLPTG